MVFKRRKKLHWVETLRNYILPRAGWRRTLTYMAHRLRRLPDSPGRIARGIGFGVFASFSPFFGLHIIYALILARLFGGNMIAAAAGTFFGNPITFPFIIGFALKYGTLLLGRNPAEHDMAKVGQAFRDAGHSILASFKSLFGFGQSQMSGMGGFFSEVMLPYFIGGTLLGAIFGVAAFYITRPLIKAYQALRRKKLAQKARKKALKG